MKIIMWILFPFLFFTFLNLWTVFISGRGFGACIPVTMMCAALVLYFSQFLLKSFYPGYYLMLVLAAAGAVLLIIKGKDSKLIENCFSFGFYGFVALYLIFIIVDFHSHVSQWDELSHWGKMVKEMLRLNSFYSEPASNLLAHKDYPPFIPTFEMLWCMLTGGYSEDSIMAALHVFEFSLLLPPVLDRQKDSSKSVKAIIISSVFTVVMALFISTLDAGNKFNTLFIDLAMPIIYAYAISFIIDGTEENKTWRYIAILVTQTALILSKQMSIAFVLLAWFIYTALIIFDGEKGNAAKKAALSAGVLVVPGINYIIWSRYIKSLGILGQFSVSNMSIKTIASILCGGGSEDQRYTYRSYIKALYSTELSSGIFNLTYISAALLALLLIFAIYKLNNDKTLKKKYISYAALLTIGAAGYAFTMLITYMFSFTHEEMLRLASYQRYMSSYVISEGLVVMYLLLDTLRKKEFSLCTFKRAAALLALALLVFDSSKLECLCPRIFYDEAFYSYRVRAEKIQSNTDSDANILLLGSDNIWQGNYINYYLDGRYIDVVGSWGTGSVEDEGYWSAIEAALDDNDYVYIYDTSENVNSVMGDMFDTEPEDGVLYAIDRLDSDSVFIRKII